MFPNSNILSALRKLPGILLLSLLVLFASFNAATAQTESPGKITGQFVDSETGESLIGVTAMLKGTSMGAASDLEGNYTIKNVPPGIYELIINYIGYAKATVQNVEVKSGDITKIDLALTSEAYKSDDVIVEARAVQNTEAALLKKRQKSTSISDAISSEALARSGSGDAADAMSKVTGATVQSGKYVIIRGLGERYSSAQINGAELPSADPDKKAFQMDLLPTNLLDNIVVSKSFTPEKPGNFSGGVVDINTKTFPESFMLKVSSSSSYNSQANLNDSYLTYLGGDTDWLGFDDGTRDIPSSLDGDTDVPSISYAYSDPEAAYTLDELTNAFNSTMTPISKSRPLNHGLSVAVGDKSIMFGKDFGYLASFSYSRNFEYYEDGEVGRYRLSSSQDSSASLNTDFVLNDSYGKDNVLWGGLFTGMLKLSPTSEIGMNFIHTQGGESEARYLTGKYYDGNLPEDAVYETRVLQYTERTLNSLQLRGQHLLAGFKNIKAEWIGTYNRNTQDEPDLRYFSNHYTVVDGDTLYTIRPSVYTVPQRYYRDLTEDNLSYDLKLSLPFNQWNGLSSKFTTGGYVSMKKRDFNESVYELHNQDASSYDGDADYYFGDSNMGIIDSTGGYYNFGNYVVDASELRSNYEGEEYIYAVFGMFDMPITYDLRFIGGVRYEITDMTTTTEDPTYEPGVIDTKDILPSASFVYSLTENMNIRSAYGRTLARPTFREMAPFPSWDFANGFFFIGNSELERTLIDNIDLRWEWFVRPGEILAASVFYKFFDNPIERAIKNDNGEIQYQNVDEAIVYGAEFEVRKNLDVISAALRNFELGGNLSLIHSEVDIPESELVMIRSYDPEADDTRQLQGQSPYIINVDFTYNNRDSRTMASLSFNIFGERLSEVGFAGTPDVYEQPRPKLNFVFNQGVYENLNLKFKVTNILDAKVSKVHHYNGSDFIYQEYKTGRTFSLGLNYNL